MLPLSSNSVFVRAAPHDGLKRTRVEGLRKKMRAIARVQNVKVTGLWDMRRLTNTDYQTADRPLELEQGCPLGLARPQLVGRARAQ